MRLRIKLIIAFTGIVILMALLQSFYFQQKIENDFQIYVNQNEEELMIYWQEVLLEYYQQFQSWDHVQEFLLENLSGDRPHRGYMGGNENTAFPRMSNLQIIVADEKGIAVADTGQQWVGESVKKISGSREELMVNGKKVGEVIFLTNKGMGFQTIEQQFIQSINRSILFGTVISVIFAVILGIFLSKEITKPLEKLIAGIRHLATGDTKYRVTVETKDEFHRLAEAFNDMSEKLEKNEEVRKNLVADVAHELRTPLSVLAGQFESIQEGAIQPTQEVIIQLSDEVYRLSRLVNDLQQLSLAEAGKLVLHKRRVQINQLIQRVIYNFKWLAEEKSITLHFNENAKLETDIDSDRMTQVIINLLGNSLRHTPEHGKVTIELNENNNRAWITIEDTGPGIDPEFLPYIFDRFYRTDASRSRDQGGTGLGLSIAKGFVEAHQGTITAESQKGEGTKFTISLPITDK